MCYDKNKINLWCKKTWTILCIVEKIQTIFMRKIYNLICRQLHVCTWTPHEWISWLFEWQMVSVSSRVRVGELFFIRCTHETYKLLYSKKKKMKTLMKFMSSSSIWEYVFCILWSLKKLRNREKVLTYTFGCHESYFHLLLSNNSSSSGELLWSILK
jgi:hypothetical protein